MVAAPAVAEALALAPVAEPVVDAPEVAADEPPDVGVWVAVPVLSVVGRREALVSRAELEPEGAAVLPALAEEQLSPALTAEQKAWAAGRTSSALGVSI